MGQPLFYFLKCNFVTYNEMWLVMETNNNEYWLRLVDAAIILYPQVMLEYSIHISADSSNIYYALMVHNFIVLGKY